MMPLSSLIVLLRVSHCELYYAEKHRGIAPFGVEGPKGELSP